MTCFCQELLEAERRGAATAEARTAHASSLATRSRQQACQTYVPSAHMNRACMRVYFVKARPAHCHTLAGATNTIRAGKRMTASVFDTIYTSILNDDDESRAQMAHGHTLAARSRQ